MPNYNFREIEKCLVEIRAGRQPARHNAVVGIITEKIDTNSPIGKAVFVIISAIAALERDLIAERVRNGLANARAKGKQIGRKKLRDSDLIRKLLKSGLSFRKVSSIARCSHGSVSAEKQAMKREEAAALAKIEAEKIAQERLIEEQKKTMTVKFAEIDDKNKLEGQLARSAPQSRAA